MYIAGIVCTISKDFGLLLVPAHYACRSIDHYWNCGRESCDHKTRPKYIYNHIYMIVCILISGIGVFTKMQCSEVVPLYDILNLPLSTIIFLPCLIKAEILCTYSIFVLFLIMYWSQSENGHLVYNEKMWPLVRTANSVRGFISFAFFTLPSFDVWLYNAKAKAFSFYQCFLKKTAVRDYLDAILFPWYSIMEAGSL